MKKLFKKIDQALFKGHLRNLYIQLLKYHFLFKTLTLDNKKGFLLDGVYVPYYTKGPNINRPPFRMTERCLELALADLFLKQHEQVTEVGAVSPYYWPNRIRTVVDPYDKHILVTDRIDWLDFNDTSNAILSISTFEHIGLDDYGLQKNDEKGEKAFYKLLNSKVNFLVTWPGGYNTKLDLMALKSAENSLNIRLYLWQRRETGNNFFQIKPSDLIFPLKYGPYWANTVFVLHRGLPLVE